MKKILILLAAVFAFASSPAMSEGRLGSGLVAKIDLSSQRMKVYQNGWLRYTWKISSGRKGFATPKGTYRPTRMYKKYFSKKYDNAPMPNSIFFRGGYAIHGTDSVNRLGKVASHGCVRLSRRNAAKLYSLVERSGRKMKIKIVQ